MSCTNICLSVYLNVKMKLNQTSKPEMHFKHVPSAQRLAYVFQNKINGIVDLYHLRSLE